MSKNKKKKKYAEIDRFPKKYDTSEVLAWTKEHGVRKDKKKRIDFDGHSMKPYSVRYETFNASGVDCVVCGAKGMYFYKERSKFMGKTPNTNGKYHFNLYGVDANGDEVLMTKDHIIAHALGGKDTVDNMQTMCSICNNEKGKMTVDEWDVYLKDKERTNSIIVTDPSTNQTCIKVSDTIFIYNEDGCDEQEIDITEYSKETIESVINGYGYTLNINDNPHNELSLVDVYGDDVNMIIAECLFESWI